MRIWVNGAGGMVGSHMVEMLQNRGEEVLGSYYRPTVELKEINPAIRMVECDVRYPQSVLKIVEKFRPETIFHLAAQSYPTVSWERPYETMEINAGGTLRFTRRSSMCAAPILLMTPWSWSPARRQSMDKRLRSLKSRLSWKRLRSNLCIRMA